MTNKRLLLTVFVLTGCDESDEVIAARAYRSKEDAFEAANDIEAETGKETLTFAADTSAWENNRWQSSGGMVRYTVEEMPLH